MGSQRIGDDWGNYHYRKAPLIKKSHITLSVRGIWTLKQWAKGGLGRPVKIKYLGRGRIQNPNYISRPILLFGLLIQQEIPPFNIFLIFLDHFIYKISLIFPCEKVRVKKITWDWMEGVVHRKSISIIVLFYLALSTPSHNWFPHESSSSDSNPDIY